MKSAFALCAGLFLVICISDQLSSVTGHSLKSASARREKNGGKRTESLMEEIMNEIRDERRQQKSINHVRSIAHRKISARLHHSIAPAEDEFRASGLAIRANKLYSAYYMQATIAIHDTSTFSRQRRLNVTGLHCTEGMASCPDCDVVFIAGYCYPFKIHVIDDVGQLRTQWNVNTQPFGVSVNSQSNVIVTFYYTHKLREYTSSGDLVREITLQSGIEYPQHAIQLDNDRYVVSHVGSLHRVCIVNGNGAVVVQCYGGQSGSGVGQLSYPRHLALFGESLLVADTNNFRVLQLNVSSLTYIGELINTRSEGRSPTKLAVNEDDARLYVAGYSGDVNCPINVYNLITE